jgi:hypothetical protein
MFLDIEILRHLIQELGGEVKFDTECTVKMTPHSYPIKINSVKIEGDEIIAYGGVKIEVSSPSPLSNTLIQRLKLIRYQKLGIKESEY